MFFKVYVVDSFDFSVIYKIQSMIYWKVPLYLSRLGSLLQDYKNILSDFAPFRQPVLFKADQLKVVSLL